jgi:hypothetical protein
MRRKPMNPDAIERVTREVVRTYTEMQGVSPTVRRETRSAQEQYVLTYKAKIILPGGKTMTRIVHVTADERGRVQRISTSR